jgi:hypothetical protein
MKSGYGEFILKDKRYIGYYKNDKKDGFGIYIWRNVHKSFLGFWKEGKQFGFGKYISNNKIKFGIWKDENDVDWIDESESNKILNDKKLEKYKKIFEYNYDDINNVFMYNDEYEKIIVK